MNPTKKTLSLALLGYGKMGKMVESIAKQKGHEIAAVVSSTTPWLNLENTEIWIDFSSPKAVLPHVHEAGKLKKKPCDWDYRMGRKAGRGEDVGAPLPNWGALLP
jgi:hypothetical protein